MNTRAPFPDWMRDRRAWTLAVIGLLLVASGLAHLVVWAVLGGPWEGPVTWRKPILFGISGGLTSLSLGWVWSRLPWRRGDGWLAASAAWALLVEVAAIDMQAWRGVASHFNRSTPFDSVLYDAMGVLILWVTLVAVDLTVRCFRQPTGLSADMLLAARAGLVLLVVSCLLGIWVSVHGDLRMAAGLAPERYGAAGVPKFPHGAVIHAVQWLPLLAWAARRARFAERQRVWLVAAATVGTALIGCFALVQTLAGRSRLDVTPVTAAVLAVGIACLVGPAVAIAARLGGVFTRGAIMHAMRVAVVAALAWLVHAEHVRFVGRQATADLAGLPVERVQRHLPEAVSIGGPSAAVAGARDLLDAAGERVGTLLRTSPAGDAAIGFSGPTDLVVVCDRDLRVAGMEVLASRDTRDHVRAIERDAAFWQSFRGKSLDELAGMQPDKAHAVAGATLTSLAIMEALVRRLGGTAAASRFEHPPALADLKLIYPDAVRIEPDPGDPAVIRVLAADAIPLGFALRTSPAADRLIGYQGPTDAVVGFDVAGKVCGVVVLASYDNEPYVGYVRDDAAFRGVYRGMTLESLAGIDPGATGVEGVSGATMTSQAVAAGIATAARQHVQQQSIPPRPSSLAASMAAVMTGIDGPQWGALGVIAIGIVTAFTRLRGRWFGRLALPIVVLAYLGFGAGALLSQAQLLGWAQAGVPRGAVVLGALALAALVLPIATRRNVYCAHLCAHGAAQQLLVRFVKPKRSFPGWLKPWLVAVPWTLLTVAILAALFHWPLNLVDLEPFDAYLPTVAGAAALVIFAVSLVVSSVVPMAYCRHGCPTGALLDHLRLHRRADRLTWRDGVLLGCLAVAAAVHWWPL